MKILLAPSEAKNHGGDNLFNSSNLIFKNLNREELIDRYNSIVLSDNREKISKMFGLKKDSDIDSYIKNIYSSKTLKAIDRYSGVAFDYLDYSSLDDKSQEYIYKNLLIFSNLFGVVRANDLIPDYRLKQGEMVEDIKTDKFYKESLSNILNEYCKDEEILNLSANYYNKFYKPNKRYTTVKFLKNGKVVSHWAKAYRGVMLRALAQSGVDSIDGLIKLEVSNLSLVDMKKFKDRDEIIYEVE